MPNGKPHLDGRLSVGARRVIGDIKCTTTVTRHNPAAECTGRDDGPDDDGETVPADSYQDLYKLAGL